MLPLRLTEAFFYRIPHLSMKNLFLLLISALFISLQTFAQNFYRVSGDYTVKSKSENASQLVIGRFFYDKTEKKIIHCNNFPEIVEWVTSDTNLYKVVNNKIVSRQTIPNFTEFSIYNMILNNNLKNFGLENSPFILDKVENENGLVISTWIPPKKLSKQMGKVMISSKDDNLFGIVFFNAEGKILKKQFFEDYSLLKGLPFPGRIVEITYTIEGKALYLVTSSRNVVVNDHNEENLYHFTASDYQ